MHQTFSGMRRMFAVVFAIVLIMTGCARAKPQSGGTGGEPSALPAAPPTEFDGGPGPGGMPERANKGVTVAVSPKRAELSKRDINGAWEKGDATHIAFSGTDASVTGGGAALVDGALVISEAGTYVLRGTFAGTVTVDATKDDKIQLVLNGASVTCDNGPALTVKKADKVFVTAASGTQNALTDAAEYETIDDDGEPDGCLFSKDDLTLNGAGALTVTANRKHGVVAKDELVVCDVQLTVTAAGDGLKSNDGTTVAGGASLTVTSGGDALETEGDCIIESGDIAIHAGDGGIKADGGIYCNGGAVRIDSCVEGLEGLVVCLADGEVDIVSSDDGVNATGEHMPGAKGGGKGLVEGAIIAVLGGKLSVQAGGDGLDSNGDLLIAGGETYISIDGNADEAALDFDGGAELTGGTLVAAGGAHMVQPLKCHDDAPVLCVTAESMQPAGTPVTLTDAGGQTLLSYTPAQPWQNVILRAPGMALGGTVAVLAGSETLCTVTLESAWTAYGTAGGFGGGMPPDGAPPPPPAR